MDKRTLTLEIIRYFKLRSELKTEDKLIFCTERLVVPQTNLAFGTTFELAVSMGVSVRLEGPTVGRIGQNKSSRSWAKIGQTANLISDKQSN